jgi:hypothetical protein
MAVSEKKAQEMWCPMARVWESNSIEGEGGGFAFAAAAVNVRGLHRADKRVGCIGSRCMMWRWAVSYPGDEFIDIRYSQTHGYCGLAGKP